MAKQPTDDELNLRRKARRRLIGAVALTLAVVVILPMVLDSEPKPAVQDIELRIPDPDKAGEFVPGAAASEVAESAPLAASAVETAPAAPEAGTVQTKPLGAATQQPTAPSPATSQAAAPQKTGEPAGSENFVAQVGAYASADAARQELDRLKKLGFRKAYTERVGDKTRVRVGPYPEREKAEQVRQMLEKHGLKPVVMSAR
jgi:DedD protein